MSEQEILDHLDRWSREFEQRLRGAGLPVRKRHETSSGYRRASAKDDQFAAREKFNDRMDQDKR